MITGDEVQIILKVLDAGVFAGLFFYLFMYMLRTNKEREERYIGLIHEMADRLNLLQEIAEALRGLRDDFKHLSDKIDRIEREIYKGGEKNA